MLRVSLSFLLLLSLSLPAAAESLEAAIARHLPPSMVPLTPMEKSPARASDGAETLLLPMLWTGSSAGQNAVTIVYFTNVTDQPAAIALEFLDSAGKLVEVSLSAPQMRLSTVGGLISARSIGGIITAIDTDTARRLTGRLTVVPAGAIQVSGYILAARAGNVSVLGIPAIAPRSESAIASFFVSSGADGHLVAASAAQESLELRLTAISNSGQSLCAATVTLEANGARDFSYRESLPCLRFFEGLVTVQIQAPNAVVPFAGYTEVENRLGSHVPTAR